MKYLQNVFQGRSFLDCKDYTPAEISYLIDFALHLDDQLIFMHCLPAFHDRTTQVGEEIYEKYGLNEMEVTDEVFNSKYAWQFTEAENRLHSIKAVMAATLGNLFIPIACGGGGIPVIVKDGHLRGVAGVIDKDFSAAKMAEDINADESVILTTVDHAFLNYGKENQQAIGDRKSVV